MATSASSAARRAGAITAAGLLQARAGGSGRPARNSRHAHRRAAFRPASRALEDVPPPDATRSPSAARRKHGAGPAALVLGSRVDCDRMHEAAAAERRVTRCGHGCRPRIGSWMSAPARVQSTWPSAFGQPRSVGGHATRLAAPPRRGRPPGDRRRLRGAARTERRPGRAHLSGGSSGADRRGQPWPASAPASSAFTTRMIVTPVSGSPAMTARWMGDGAAPARQQRRVDVDHAEARQRDATVRQDLAVGGHDAQVGRQRPQLVEKTRVPERSGCQTGMPQPRGARLHRQLGCTLLSAPARAVGLGDDADDRVRRSRAGRRAWARRTPACRRSDAHGGAVALTTCPRVRQLLDLAERSAAARYRAAGRRTAGQSRWSISCCRARASRPRPSIVRCCGRRGRARARRRGRAAAPWR